MQSDLHPFLCALGEACFFNEYVFAEQAGEREAAEASGIPALQSCYRPLTPDVKGEGGSFAQLYKAQVVDAERETDLKAGFESFGAIADDISKAVRAQYEEHPYPRWRTISLVPLTRERILPDASGTRPEILIAGCGTGRHPIEVSSYYPDARITAIDLSRASLAYAARMADVAQIDNIRFVHADILSIKDWPTRFDLIESVGVLHHMDDPFAGWAALVDRLKPGGRMEIGLYSEAARRYIVEARDFIAREGYASTTEAIRTCRADIFAGKGGSGLRDQLCAIPDFYSTSTVRDLIFHTQEHRLTLPQIDDMMARLGLRPVRMIVSDASAYNTYRSRFPDDPDMKNFSNWHLLEQDHPSIFAGMYQFWCQKI